MNVKSKVLSVFDFDGTLTYRDSFIPFLYFSFGKSYFIKHVIRMILPIFHGMRNRLTRDELKEILIRTFLSGIDKYWLERKAEAFCKQAWKKLMRPAGILAVMKEVRSGAEVTICSASPILVLQPFADKLGIKVIGTQLQVKSSKFTGNIIGYNCRCSQKLKKLEQIYGDLKNYHLRAWGDSYGDYELLSVAQDPHWKHFHKTSLFSKNSDCDITLF